LGQQDESEAQDADGDGFVDVDEAVSNGVASASSSASTLTDEPDAGASGDGLFDDDDLQYVDPDQPQDILQQLKHSIVLVQDSTRVSIRGVRYFATPLTLLSSAKSVMSCRSVVRYVQHMPSGNVATGVGVVVAITIPEDQPIAHVVPLPYSLQVSGTPLIPRLGLHSVLLAPKLEADGVVFIPCCQLLNPVVLDPHPASQLRFTDGTLMCFALNVNAERYYQ
jgi:hypothetical protein